MGKFTAVELARIAEADAEIDRSFRLSLEDLDFSRGFDKESKLLNMDNKRRETLVKAKAYRTLNKDKISAYRKNYYAQHKAEILAKKRLYRESHKEEISEYGRAYYQAHKEEMDEKNRLYRATHKEQIRKYDRDRKRRRRADNG